MLLIGASKTGKEKRFYKAYVPKADVLYEQHLQSLEGWTMARKFSELTKDFAPERRARIEARKADLRQEMDLAELRHALALTQSTLAETLGVGQAEVSKIEQRTDVFVSTLRRFVQAMGGQLEIYAVFPDHKVAITNFSGLSKGTERTGNDDAPQPEGLR